MTTKRLTCLVVLGAGAALLAGAGCGSDGGNGQPAAPTKDSVPTSSEGTARGRPGTVAGELARYTTEQGLTRVYVLVDADISDDELVDLARTLHDDEPDVATFFFMDDDSRVDEVLAALPETERGDTSNWPAEWVTDHTVAALAMFVGYPEPPTRRWVLDRGLSPDPDNGLVVLE